MKRHSGESGAAIIWAIMLLVVVSITSVGLYSLLISDTKEVRGLEERMSLYYASLAGIEYGHGALLAPYGSTGEDLLTYYIEKEDKGKIYQGKYEIKSDDGTIVAFSKVNISKKNITKTVGAPPEMWVVVESEGFVKGVKGSCTLYLRINTNNTAEVIRDGFVLPSSTSP